MADMPVCTRCKKPHWRFVSCDDAAKQPPPARVSYPITSVPDGFHVWGDRLETRDRNGWLINNPTA